jgi:ubiquinone/menaquinone biosynthesis C-methylase UbiE
MTSASVQPIPLPLDGERFVPGEMHGNIELEHRHRYLFASQFVSGKAVLDIACGEGYGSALLAKSARRVIGVDIADRAVEHAKQRYQAENLEFAIGSCAAIPLGDGAVEVVVSFETIEHHAEHEAMMHEINRVLRPGGLLVISSPDKLEYSDKPSFRNPFHVKELYEEEFQELLSTHFRNVRLFGQRVVFGSMLLGDQQSQGIRFQRSEREPAPPPGDLEPVYWVAMASEDPLPVATDSVYEQPTAAFWGTVNQQRNSTLAKLIRVIAASSSEQLRSCLQREWYLQQNDDLVATGVDPYEHWIELGAQEGRLPSSDPLSLVEELLREREQLQQQNSQSRQEQLIQTREHLESELAHRERVFAEQLDQQQAGFNAQRATLGEAADQKLAALVAENSERERLLVLDVQGLQARLQQTQRQAQETLEQSQRELQEHRIFLQEELAQARRETRVQVESHLEQSAQREQAFAGQLLLQQEKFDSERAALCQAMEQRLVTQAEEHIERERRLRQDIQGLQERLQQTQSQSREILERAHTESQERLEQAQKKSLEQLAQQQAGFNAERATRAEATDQKLETLAARYADRERQFQEDLQYLQERLDRTQREAREQVESQLQHLVEREQAFAGQLLQQQGNFNAQLATLAAEFGKCDLGLRQQLLVLQKRSELMMAEDRNLLRSQYSSVLTDLKRDLEILQTSMSWRLAAPIRAVATAFGSKARLPQVGEIDALIHLSLDHKGYGE